MNLHAVPLGEKVKVKDLQQIDTLLCKRLNAFGIKEGCQVCMIQKGWFSGACILECQGQKIGLRKKDLMDIKVEQV
ncbi:ferrous iron transport protein A [Lysinibacillus xylanilyticus]|uniref:FeoA family protein n=1 Tax=Lysinibacillus xylanilyticus TaxID=582475 RepID=UPI00104D3E53|nr:FeoA domain-containing protein [Lysinibacillus xylanilyticus]MEB2279315.1 ferrous iron transport protein A [Lysinibacillus xylanilyticus]